MSCDEFDAGLQSLSDGEAGDGEDALRAHAAACPACAARLREHLALRRALRLSAMEGAPAGARLRALAAAARAAAARDTPPAILTLPEVAAFLRVTEIQVRRMLSQIPHFVVAGEVRFRRQSLERWIEREERRRSTSVFMDPVLSLLAEDDAAAWSLVAG